MNSEELRAALDRLREEEMRAAIAAIHKRVDEFTMDTYAYKRAVADDVSHEDALVHAKRYRKSDEYACLYNRARTCGASHAQAARHADACIHARVSALKYAEADWSPENENQCPPYEISARLERIERLLLAR